MSSISIQQKGIVSIPADAIVNAANTGLLQGGGVCGAIFKTAGAEELAKACNAIGYCGTGNAVITPGFKCPCKYIIHAVGPVYHNGKHGEPGLLYSAYTRSLELCRENDLHSVVFPLISAGIFGYPVLGAWEQAVHSCRNFISENPDYDIDVIFAIPDAKNVETGTFILQRETAR